VNIWSITAHTLWRPGDPWCPPGTTAMSEPAHGGPAIRQPTPALKPLNSTEMLMLQVSPASGT
jgi:hypothetical protein